ncbi:MAG: MATE family efflux transporter [Eubacterium sp.]|nr:MATE family efflux transporter [Eubacterium sp.]
MEKGIHKYIGDRRFYRRLMMIAVPIMIQNAITNFVSLLDNIMVGQIGTEQMSGVAIVNQLMFVYILAVFGGVSGVGIFTAQYYGQRDDEGIRATFRYKLWVGVALVTVAVVIFTFFGGDLIQLYLSGDSSVGDVKLALGYGKTYLGIMVFGLPAIAISFAYSGTMRDCSKTVMPMVAGVTAVLTNVVLDYLLIFGKFGFPKLGVAGAAMATVIARYVEMSIVIIWCHTHTKIYTYAKGLYRTLRVPWRMTKEFLIKGTPILINETVWSAGMAMLMQCYSMRGMEVVAAANISNTVNNLLNVIFVAMGDAVAIIVGQLLGAGKMEEAKSTDTKIIAFSFASGFLVAGGIIVFSFFFPGFYNTSPEVKALASGFMRIQAAFTPMIAILHCSYFTLRSGGKTIITFLFDSGVLWTLSVPTAFLLSRFTGMGVLWILAIINMIDMVKCAIGLILIKKNVWMNKITV